MWKRKFDDSAIVKASESTRVAINTAATNGIQSTNRSNFSIQLRNSSYNQTHSPTSTEKLSLSKENINNKSKKGKLEEKQTEKAVLETQQALIKLMSNGK
jgi:hypothetical protein